MTDRDLSYTSYDIPSWVREGQRVESRAKAIKGVIMKIAPMSSYSKIRLVTIQNYINPYDFDPLNISKVPINLISKFFIPIYPFERMINTLGKYL